MTQKMTKAQVVEKSVTINNSPFQDHAQPDDHSPSTFEMTLGFKPCTVYSWRLDPILRAQVTGITRLLVVSLVLMLGGYGYISIFYCNIISPPTPTLIEPAGRVSFSRARFFLCHYFQAPATQANSYIAYVIQIHLNFG